MIPTSRGEHIHSRVGAEDAYCLRQRGPWLVRRLVPRLEASKGYLFDLSDIADRTRQAKLSLGDETQRTWRLLGSVRRLDEARLLTLY